VRKNEKLHFIVPFYNESEVLKKTIQKLVSAGFVVIAVDDGSSDSSIDSIIDLPIVTLRHAFNLGQGAALNTGLEYCRRNNIQYAVTFDGDGQHRLEDAVAMFEELKLNSSDIVLGSRFLKSESIQSLPSGRKLLLRLATSFTRLQFGLKISDTHNGLRVLGRRAIESIDFQSNRMAHASEIYWFIKKYKLKYKEYPVVIDYHEYSLNKGQSFLSAPGILIEYFFTRILRK
tara:strand:+ start:39950 stop:40642 length:693 start_codon:yes stop_codon:yes gene_type:complete